METFRINWKVFLYRNVQLGEARPGVSGNPFLWLEKLRQKDWEPFDFAQDKLWTDEGAQILNTVKILSDS